MLRNNLPELLAPRFVTLNIVTSLYHIIEDDMNTYGTDLQ